MHMPQETISNNDILTIAWHQESYQIQLGSAPNQPFRAIGATMVLKRV